MNSIRPNAYVLLAVCLIAWPLSLQVAAQPAPCVSEAGPVGCLDLTLSPASLVGDIYLDGQFVVAQVHATRLNVAPDALHTVEVRNVADSTAGFGDLFVYDDASQANMRAATGQIRTLTLYPRQRYVKGTLVFTCDIRGLGEGHLVACRPTIDGAPQADVGPGAQASYNLAPGAHALHVDLAGEHAGLWSPPAADHTANVTVGRTTTLRSTYNRKGLLTVVFNVPNVVGDIYVDGVLIASQVATTQTYVAPSANHTVEAKALTVTDPAAAALYRYDDASATAWLGANQARTTTLRPRQVYLVGFAAITCQINRIQAGEDARCAVTADGLPLGDVEQGATVTYNLPPGPHAFAATVGGAQAHRWGGNPVAQTITITGGRTSRYTFRFNPLPPTPTPPPLPTPSAICTEGCGFLEIQNDTGANITITLSGATGAVLVFPPGTSRQAIAPGSYALEAQARCGRDSDSISLSAGDVQFIRYWCETYVVP